MRTLAITSAALLVTSVVVAGSPPDYEMSARMEEASIRASELGIPFPWLFGAEVKSHFVVSISAGRGQLALGRLAFRQLDPSVVY